MIHVNTFGRFELTRNNETQSIRFSSKVNCLLAYLIIHRNELCNREKIMEEFWGETEYKNPINALKTTIFRLRTSLNEIFGSNAYILQVGNGYQWNPAIPIQLDTELMQKYYLLGNNITLPINKRIDYYENALHLYRGQFMVESFGYSWIDNMNQDCRTLYFDIVLKLAEILQQKEDYSALENLCQKALTTSRTNEDIHYYYILSKLMQKKYDEALDAYDYAEDVLGKELGTNNSENFAELWNLIYNNIEDQNNICLQEIEDKISEDASQGASLCCYSFFKEIAKLESCRYKREKSSQTQKYTTRYLSLININSLNEQTDTDHKDNTEVFQTLEKTICTSLQSGDTVAHCNYHQYVVLLYGGTKDDCRRTLNRMKTKLIKAIPDIQIDIYYKELLDNCTYRI